MHGLSSSECSLPTSSPTQNCSTRWKQYDMKLKQLYRNCRFPWKFYYYIIILEGLLRIGDSFAQRGIIAHFRVMEHR
jgi:hypothetical protein